MTDRESLVANPASYLFTADEVAELLRTTRKAIYKMTERGQLPGVTRVGRRLLYRRAHLLEWLDQNPCAIARGVSDERKG